jgi:hypothetical protein
VGEKRYLSYFVFCDWVEGAGAVQRVLYAWDSGFDLDVFV